MNNSMNQICPVLFGMYVLIFTIWLWTMSVYWVYLAVRGRLESDDDWELLIPAAIVVVTIPLAILLIAIN